MSGTAGQPDAGQPDADQPDADAAGQAAGHPASRLDDVVHQRTRLGVLAVLVEGGRTDFVYLREALGLTDGNLSRTLTKLAEAGLVRVDKTAAAPPSRTRTWVVVTVEGRRALAEEVAALRELIGRLESSTGPRAGPRDVRAGASALGAAGPA